MRLSLRIAGVFACASLVLACTPADPNQAETWFKNLSSKKQSVQLDALAKLRKIGDKAAVPAIVPLLQQDGEVKAEAAKVLGKLEDPAAVPALIEAIDFEIGVGADKASKDANIANKEIAEALGALGDKAAVEPLLKLVASSKDPFAKVAAINALGSLGDTRAVAELSRVATNESEETYVARKAIEALGRIGDPAAVPAIKKMLFHERKGVSFYAEASLAAYQIGPAAGDPLLVVLEGKDEELLKWADDNNIFREALYIKAAEILGDLNEEKAIPTLVKLVGYEDPQGRQDMVLLVRRNAAIALGRMQAKEAVPALIRGLGEDEGNIRAMYASALVNLGDQKAIPALIACSLKGEVLDKSAHARKGCYVAVSRLGDAKAMEQWEAWEKAEPARSSAACMKELTYSTPKAKENAQKHCDELAANVVKTLEENKPRLAAAVECTDKTDCWVGKLKDENPVVRERAAMELGRLNDAKATAALMEALADDSDEVRIAAITSVDRLASASKDALATAVKGLEKLDAQIESEKGKIHFARVNQDLTRLAMKIRRLDRTGS